MIAVLSTPFATFAASAVRSAFPEEARRRAVDAIADCVGCQLAGSSHPIAEKLLSTFAWSADKSALFPAHLVGRGAYAGAADSAFFGGSIAHALDYDDTNHPAYAHPSAVIWPAVLAVSILVNAKGKELVNAYIAGFEVFGKLGRALNTAHYSHGWHTTGTFGALAASVAASAMMQLTVRQTETAIAIAASSASGLRANFGTMVKPMHAGLAARAGVTAAQLAKVGFTATREALEHQYGYLSVFSGGVEPMSHHLSHPGQDLEILTEFGLALKPYPCCGATHPGIEAALALRERIGVREIASVRVGVSAFSFKPLIYDNPQSPLEAKFSMQYCVAAAFSLGCVRLETFTNETLSAPAIAEMMKKVSVVVDDRVRESKEFATIVTVVLTDGEIFEQSISLAKGKPARWFSEAEIEGKFFDCASSSAYSRESAERLFSNLRRLDSDIPVCNLFEPRY